MYDTFIGVAMNVFKWAISVILLDLILGIVILKYTNPIAFSEQHPYVVLWNMTFILLLPLIIKKYRKLQFTECRGISIQFIEE